MRISMFRVVAVVAIAGGGVIFLGETGKAAALAFPGVVDGAATPKLVEEAGWRRQWRRGYGAPVVVVPDAGVVADPEVEVEADSESPPVIFLPPPRPVSCGVYRYWNGDRCVDARYNNPYLGPR